MMRFFEFYYYYFFEFFFPSLAQRIGDYEAKIRMLVETVKNEREQHRREIEKLLFGGGDADDCTSS